MMNFCTACVSASRSTIQTEKNWLSPSTKSMLAPKLFPVHLPESAGDTRRSEYDPTALHIVLTESDDDASEEDDGSEDVEEQDAAPAAVQRTAAS